MAVAVPVGRDVRNDPRVEPLRILWLIDSLTMGGAESLAVAFARAARSRGLDVTICARTTIDGNPLEGEIRGTGVHLENLGARNLRDVAAFRRLLRVIRERRIDVIHAHLAYAGMWGAIASRITGVPVVASLHVSPPGARGREAIRQRLLTFLLNQWASRVVAVSAALREDWLPRIHAEKFVVIHNGVEDRETTSVSAPRRRRFRVTTVAVLREDKGVDILIEAARRIVRRVAEIEFVVIGDGPMRETWAKRSDGLPFVWTGYRRDVASFLDDTDLFVLPTLADAFPTVLLEAMRSAVPVVASNVGGIPEIVDSPHTGILVPPGDVTALAEAIIRVAGDHEWRRRASTAARVRFEELFSIDRWMNRLQSLYAEVAR